MAYVDLATIFDPAPDEAPPAEWGDQIRDNLAYFYERTERVIARAVLAAPAALISSGTLPAVPNGWMLRFVFRVRHATGTENLRGRFNGDSSFLYNHDDNAVTGAANNPNSATSQDSFRCEGVSSIANQWTIGDFKVPDYLAADHKSFIGNTGRNGVTMTTSGIWRSTAPISSVQVFPAAGNLATGSSLIVLATPLPV